MTQLAAGKVALVTGGASGIGRAAALRLAEEGAKAVIVADRLSSPREEGVPTQDRIAAETGAEGRFVECDVRDLDQIAAAVEAGDEFGGIDILVTAAGIFRRHEFLEVGEREYDEMMDVNAKGVFFCCQAAARKMVASGRGGAIVNISSVAGLHGSGPHSTYSASKGAVRLLSYSLAEALGPHGIRVNAIHPGIIETMMTTADQPMLEELDPALTPLRRHGKPLDIANAVVFLASDLADYVSGASLLVDGGSRRGQ